MTLAKAEQAQVSIDPRGRLEQRPARPGAASPIWAVDRRENGCSMMVMMGDLKDVRPIPRSSHGDAHRFEAEE